MSAGQGSRGGLLIAALLCCAGEGCGSAHYVIRNPNNGVVAISADTPELRAKAERLMHEQFPGGYVIDDVRVVPVGRPYQTITRVGGFTEIDENRHHEVMLYYHAGQSAPVMPVPVGAPVVTAAASPGPLPSLPVQPASLTAQPSQQGGLPSQPVPIR